MVIKNKNGKLLYASLSQIPLGDQIISSILYPIDDAT